MRTPQTSMILSLRTDEGKAPVCRQFAFACCAQRRDHSIRRTAPGIAAINSIGNLSGYFGPFAMGYIKDATGSFTWGLVAVAICAVIAVVITLALGHDHSLEKAPQQEAA